MRAQGRGACLDGALQVLRIVVDATDYDDVLDAPGDEELACFVDKPEITGAKPALIGFPFEATTECCGGGLDILPISLGNIRATNPNLPNIARLKPPTCFWIDNRKPFTDECLAAACD